MKRDGLPTYNFANVIDDHLMGITHVVRGSEYLSSSPKYNLLYEAFGWEIPTYIHCSPVMRDAQHKMSKRHGDPSYEDLKAQGYLTEAILNYVALLGWSPRGELAEQEFFTLEELVQAFDITGISKSPAIFDLEKLNYFNSAYFQAKTERAFQAIHDALLHLAEAQGLKNGRIMWPVRVAVSGKATTPGGAVELCHILGKEETLRRVQQGIRQLTPQA